jgi:PAP2 superfamily
LLREQAQATFEAAHDLMTAGNHEQRMSEILTQVTPPIAYWSAVVPLHPDRTPKTLELMHLALSLGTNAVLRFKHALACPRPYEVNARCMPHLLTPAHSALPSGHATESSAASTLLAHLLSSDSSVESQVYGRALRLLAQRVAANRVAAGVHYPIDSIAGQALGETLGRLLVARCTGALSLRPLHFDPTSADGTTRPADGVPAAEQPLVAASATSTLTPPTSAQLAWLWKLARAEWGFES